MNTNHNKFLILIALILILTGVYVYFGDGQDAQAATGTSSIVSSANSPSPLTATSASSDDQINSDTAFLMTLTSLKRIKIDTTLFMNDAFNALVDNNVKLEPVPPGRPNPFAPINATVSNITVPVAPVTTNPPIQINDKSASLYGTLANPASVTSVYFEYGFTPNLGKKTVPASQSLVGTFVTNISGLTPKTVYFYHAVAKVGGALVYGETVSFITN